MARNRIYSPPDELDALKTRLRAVAELYELLPPEHRVQLAADVARRRSIPIIPSEGDRNADA